VLEVFKISQSPDDSISNNQLEHLKKRTFTGHVTIYGYKYRLFGMKFRHFSCLRSEARVKSLSPYYALGILRAMIRKEKLAYSALGPRPR